MTKVAPVEATKKVDPPADSGADTATLTDPKPPAADPVLKADAQPEVAAPAVETIVLDLPPCAGGGISHAGSFYLSRVAYRVPPQTAADLLEIQNRCKAHEASLVESENRGRRRQNAFLRGAA